MEKSKIWIVKFQYAMLFLTILALPVFSLTKRLQIFHFSDKLSWYFALLGLIAFSIEWFFSRFKIDSKIKVFLILFLVGKYLL